MILLLFNALRLLQLVVFIRVLLTWVMPEIRDPTLRRLTDPIDRMIAPFRVVVPMGRAMLDLGPLLFLLLIEALLRVVVHLV